tara:strand:- start:2406 stop:2684 length:279 start_codon:yes stop_codon:yes gene_type:complete
MTFEIAMFIKAVFCMIAAVVVGLSMSVPPVVDFPRHYRVPVAMMGAGFTLIAAGLLTTEGTALLIGGIVRDAGFLWIAVAYFDWRRRNPGHG